jgi:hypothetical protein
MASHAIECIIENIKDEEALREIFMDQCKLGRVENAEYLYENTDMTLNPDDFYNICSFGYIELVKLYMTDVDVDIDQGFCGACRGGHKSIVKFLIKNGAGNFYDGFIESCFYDHYDIVKLITENYANSWPDSYWEMGFQRACERASEKVIKYFLEDDPNIISPELWSICLENVCSSTRNVDIVQLMINKMKLVLSDEDIAEACNDALPEACFNDANNIVDLLIDSGANYFEESLSVCHGIIEHSGTRDRIEIGKLLLLCGAKYKADLQLKFQYNTLLDILYNYCQQGSANFDVVLMSIRNDKYHWSKYSKELKKVLSGCTPGGHGGTPGGYDGISNDLLTEILTFI